MICAVASSILWAIRGAARDPNAGTPDGLTFDRYTVFVGSMNDILILVVLVKLDGMILDCTLALSCAMGWKKATRALHKLWWIELSMNLVLVPLIFLGSFMDPTSKDGHLVYRGLLMGALLVMVVRMVLYVVAIPIFLKPAYYLGLAYRSSWGQDLKQEHPTSFVLATTRLVATFANVSICLSQVISIMFTLVTHHHHGLLNILTAADCLTNVLLVIISSGVVRQRSDVQKKAFGEESHRKRTRRSSSESYSPCEEVAWQEAVEDIALRGFTLEHLLDFYQDLPQAMPHFTPSAHTTRDVVMQVIIPGSAEKQCAFSEVMTGGKNLRPQCMVTHNWSNLFRDLVAAIVADALQQSTFSSIADLLEHDLPALRQTLSPRMLSTTYWVCAFCVNQHRSTCKRSSHRRNDPVTGQPYGPCPCGSPQYFNDTPPLRCRDGKSIYCQVNKFDDMVAFLAASDPNFTQVIAVDRAFDVFSRAWCIAEIAEASKMGMLQYLKLASMQSLKDHRNRLQDLDVEQLQATRPEDREEILSKISDVSAFNASLQSLLFGQDGLFEVWGQFDVVEQTANFGRVASLAKAMKRLTIKSAHTAPNSGVALAQNNSIEGKDDCV